MSISLLGGGPRAVVHGINEAAIQRLEKSGEQGARTLNEIAAKLAAPYRSG